MSRLGQTCKHLSRLGLVTFAALGTIELAFAGENRPVAAVVIYPGDVIRENMLTDAYFPDAPHSSPFIMSHQALIGKVAKRTFLPGSPFPGNAVGVPRLISIGAMVRLVFAEDGLEILSYGSAMQNGSAGDVISVRNLESGVTISGVVQADGSVRVGPS
jgi:flagella basal body P-ring formation protein FlgA